MYWGVPSGKHTRSYGKSPFFRVYINYRQYSIAMLVYWRVPQYLDTWFHGKNENKVYELGVPHFRKPPSEKLGVGEHSSVLHLGHSRSLNWKINLNAARHWLWNILKIFKHTPVFLWFKSLFLPESCSLSFVHSFTQASVLFCSFFRSEKS